MTTACKVCGTVDHDAEVKSRCAARDRNGNYDHPHKLWRVVRINDAAPSGISPIAHTDGRGWHFTVYTTPESAQHTCEQWSHDTQGCQQFKPVEVHLSGVPHNAVCFFMAGDQLCCVFADFINLQESPAGFGTSFDEALANLKAQNAPAAATLADELEAASEGGHDARD